MDPRSSQAGPAHRGQRDHVRSPRLLGAHMPGRGPRRHARGTVPCTDCTDVLTVVTAAVRKFSISRVQIRGGESIEGMALECAHRGISRALRGDGGATPAASSHSLLGIVPAMLAPRDARHYGSALTRVTRCHVHLATSRGGRSGTAAPGSRASRSSSTASGPSRRAPGRIVASGIEAPNVLANTV
jgi:hypothetical protein